MTVIPTDTRTTLRPLRLWPGVTAAIVGVRSAKQVDGVIGALDFRLSDREFTQIEQYRLTNGF